jgi:hypothetical protein
MRALPSFSTSDSLRLRCSIRSAMVPIFRPCSAANSCRSGRRAMVPSSFMISQITAAGCSRPWRPGRNRLRYGRRASARRRRPPAAGRCGRAGPGRRALALGATAACTVRARSAAEMPVVTPSAASMDTVKAVPILVPLRPPWAAACRRSQRSRVSVRQIRPRPKRAMKLMASGVTWSAASTRSPSFSRSSSSTRMTMRPARMSATMSSTGEIAAGWGLSWGLSGLGGSALSMRST